jgi:hypothetical protein
MPRSALKYITLLVFCFGCTHSPKKYFFPEVGWTIKVSPYFEIMDSSTERNAFIDGGKLVNYTFHANIAFSAKKLLVFQKGDNCVFTSYITPFDTSKDGSWAAHLQALKNIVCKTLVTFAADLPNIQIDTFSTKERIDTIEFTEFHMKFIKQGEDPTYLCLYSQLINGYDFGIGLIYDNKDAGKKLRNVLNTSRFN